MQKKISWFNYITLWPHLLK